MSEPKRYDLQYNPKFDDSYMEEDDDGEWVRSDDYDQLRTERDRLRGAIKVISMAYDDPDSPIDLVDAITDAERILEKTQ